MKLTRLLQLSLLCAAGKASAASIYWVSDQFNAQTATVGAGPYSDDGIVALLTGAGHTVTRFNPPDAGAITAGDVAAMNAADLVIIGRSIASGAFDTAAETLPWNTLITKPLICTNTYINRSSRLGWYASGPNQPDQVLNNLSFTNLANPVTSYIVGNTAMSGNTTTNSITQAIVYPDSQVDIRGISEITDPLVAGGNSIATVAVGAATGQYIAWWPANTALAGTSAGQSLAGYRMQFLIGNRESATAGTSNNTALGAAGYENLTAEGEQMFLRAVNVALNNGAIPEPGTTALAGLAAAALLLRRRRA
ncbi:MAG TPA: PEP-CTERM sorting domain-containing protein [Verrucomicrobiales bacterium]|nr:PEP-CTERM sorting domain-containing protein [Verrucomicrobiales bacterium]